MVDFNHDEADDNLTSHGLLVLAVTVFTCRLRSAGLLETWDITSKL